MSSPGREGYVNSLTLDEMRLENELISGRHPSLYKLVLWMLSNIHNKMERRTYSNMPPTDRYIPPNIDA
jgi:hypothetical protein